ncbi:uncharacterized protein LOC144149607 [Haemaphysalis longicornis]
MGPRWQLFAAAFCIGFVAACCANGTDGGDSKTIVCYWQSWSHKRLKPYTYNVDDIPVHLCTHVIYSYAKLDNEATSLYLDEGFDTGVAGYRHFIDLKRRYPSVKLLLALGDRYGSDLAAWKNNLDNPMRQFQVLKLLYQLLRQYNFDGVHFNWEWLPEVEGVRASGPTAMSFEKFNALIKGTFRGQPPFIVSSTVSLPLLNWNGSQDSWIKIVQGYMDFFHLSSRSLSLGGDINTPISERINSSAANLLQSSSYDDLANGVHYLRHLGVPTNKLLLEIQFSGLNDPPISSSIHTVSPLTIGRKEDLVPYYEICASIREGASIHWDERQKSPYIILENGRRLHYEDTESVRRKVKQARSLGITGVVGWSVDMDNFNGVNTTKNDLLRAAFESIIHTAESSTSHELSSGSLYEGTTQMYAADEEATATATRYFDETTAEPQNYERTMVPINTSSTDGGITSEKLRTWNDITGESNATFQYEGTHEDYTTTDDYFPAQTTETPEPEEKMTAFSSSTRDEDFITEGSSTENDTINEWNATSRYQRTSEDFTSTDEYFHAVTTKTPDHESTTAFSSSHDDNSTNDNLSTNNYRTDEWNGTSHYTEKHEDFTRTDDYFRARTTETPEQEQNITALSSSSHYDDFITEGITTENDTISEWIATSHYQRTGDDLTTTDDYFQAITTKTPEHESTTAFISSSHDDDSTNNNFSTKNYRTDEWNGTSHYTEKHDDYTTTDDYFAAQTTETPEHKENITAFSSSTRDEDFITEGSSTEDDTINEWNVTSRYQRTGEDLTTTDDYFHAITTKSPEHESTTAFSSSSHDDDSTNDNFSTDNYRTDEWNGTSHYTEKHDDYTTSDDYFPAQTTETPEHKENITAFSSSTRDEDFITEGSSTKDGTINEWNVTSRYQRTGEDFTTTDDYFQAITTKTPEHESATAFSSSSHDDDSTNDNFSTENYRTDDWNGTSHYTEKHEDFTRTDDYFRARTTETPEQEENITALSSSSQYDDFITEGITTENDTISEWIATSHYQRTGDDLTTTDDYFQAITTKTPEHESTTAFISSSHDDDSTNNNFSTKNYRTDEWNGTSHYTEKHDDYTTTDDYFAAQTTETPEHKENITAFSSSTRDEDFITEGSSTEDDTINEWNVTSRYQRTGEDFTTTDDYFHAITTKSPEHESTTAFSSSSHDDDSTNDNFSTDNYRTDEWNGTSHYTEKHDDYTTSDDYFPAQTTETPEHKENITAFSSSTRDEDFITEGSSTKDGTINEWNVTSRYQRTGEDFTTTDDYFQAITTKTPEHESTTAFSSSSHDDDSTNNNFSTENYRTDEWNGTFHYTEKHEEFTRTDDYFRARTTETPDHEENITAFISSWHNDDFTTEDISTENDTINEWNATSHYKPTGESYATTDGYFLAITTETPQPANTTAFSSHSHDHDFTKEEFTTEQNTFNEWNVTSYYEGPHEDYTTTDDYFPAQTTDTQEVEINSTSFSYSPQDYGFTTEEFSTENGTINLRNATSKYEPTREAYTTTVDDLVARTTGTPEHENTTSFSSSFHDDDFTTEYLSRENGTINEWNVTSEYERTHEAYNTTNDYFPVVRNETVEHQENMTTFNSLPDYEFTTEDVSTENDTINEWNATSLYEPSSEAYTSTVDYWPETTTESPKQEENLTAFNSSSFGADFTTKSFSTENDTKDEWISTSPYETTHEAYTSTGDYFPATTTTAVVSTTASTLSNDQQSADWRCKNKTLTSVPHESDGGFFYRCYNGMALLRKCGEGQRFNFTLGRCNMVPSEIGNTSVGQQSPLSHVLMKFFGDLASGKARLGKDEKLDVNVNYSFSLNGKK